LLSVCVEEGRGKKVPSAWPRRGPLLAQPSSGPAKREAVDILVEGKKKGHSVAVLGDLRARIGAAVALEGKIIACVLEGKRKTNRLISSSGGGEPDLSAARKGCTGENPHD